jgi:hypothetical protein
MSKILKIICIAIILVTISGGFEYTRATLGPIHVELNTTGNRPSGVRANSITAFKIHIRFNVTIKSHDWVKIWFPAKEASNNFEDICDGLPALNGKSEHPRFVPNEKYFDKYPESEESKFVKMYEVMDDRKGSTKFYKGDCSEFEDESVKKNMILDKSGLGHWLLGTIMPKLPRKEEDRYHRLAMIVRSASIGYNSCGESQGLPFLKNLCNERSYQFNSPFEVDPWRKGYNPIDFNSSKATGFIAPATPGRYTIFIATAPEPTPVESEAFVLPCSQISTPKVTLTNPEPYEKTGMTVKFNVGEGGTLDREHSKVYIKFPQDYPLPSLFSGKKAVLINNKASFGEVYVDRTQKIVSFIAGTDIDKNQEASITFTDEFGLTNPKLAGKYQLEVWTDSEPEPVKSEPFEVGDLPVVIVKPDIEQTNAEYYMVGMAPKTWVKKGDQVTINFPKGTVIPDKISPSFVIVNKKPCTESIKIGENTITFTSPVETTGFLKVRILKDAKIKNAPAGEYEFTYTKDGLKHPFAKFTFTKSMPYVEYVRLTQENGCEGSGFSIKYFPSISGWLSPGDTVTVEFPEGMILPKSIDNKNVKIGSKESGKTTIDSQKVTITTNVKIIPETGAEIVIAPEAGIINTRYPGSYTLTVASSKDPPIFSPQFLVLMPKLNSKLVFKGPDEPDGKESEGCHWYKNPPILTFESCNPFAEITFWFDNKDTAKIIYTGEKKLSPGCHRTIIHYFSQVGEVKEEVKSVTLCLDSIPPAFEVSEPSSDTVINNKPTYIVEGNREPTEMVSWGDNEKYQVVDGLYINGTQIFSPEIFETLSRDGIKMKFEHKIDLKPGENIIEFKGVDQAGNEKTIKKTIIYDNIKPNIEFVSPKPGEYLEIGETVGIRIATENDAGVFIGGYVTSMLEEKPDGKTAVFEADWEVVEGENIVPIEVTDLAGNKTTTTLRFFGKKKQTVISLWLDKTTWTVNGVVQTPLMTAPTSSSPPLPKDFSGNTFMPISEVAKTLGSSVSWEVKTKMVTITQTLPDKKQNIIQLWIGNKTAKINGIETPIDPKGKLYPTLVNGKTVLPLRFVANSLQCGVVWEPKDKQIVLTYPAK